jgi:hypothetical protein
MVSGKLEVALAIELLEEWSTSGYLMIIAKAFEGTFEGAGGDVKLEVSDDGSD